MKTISKRLRQLKVDRHHETGFEKLHKKLKDEGIFDKPERTGEVVFFKPNKGYGFIRVAEDDEYFLHINEISGREIPAMGDRFIFKVGSRKSAINARKLN